MALEVACLYKAQELRYKALWISHTVAGLLLSLTFCTEDPDGVGDTVNIFLLPNPSISASSEAVLVARWWDTYLDCSMLTTFADTASLLQ